MQDQFDDLDCAVTYEQRVVILEDSVTVSAICFVSENDVTHFKRTIELPQKIIVDSSYYTWEAEGKVHIQLRKADGPSYWPMLIKVADESGYGTSQVSN